MHKIRLTRWWVVCISLALTLAVTAATIALLSSRAAAAPAAELHVCPSGCAYSSVQAAVDAAHDGDIIKVAAGVYTDVHARPRNDITTTGVVTQVVYLSKTVTIQGGYTSTNWTTPYPLTQPTTLDAQGRGRVVYITGQISPTLEGLRITGGNADQLGQEGGGVYVIHAALAISNCTIVSNTYGSSWSWYGGGIFLYNAAATLTGNTISNNYGDGVHLENASTATLADNAISNNGNVGVYLNYSAATLTGNIISNTGTGVGCLDGSVVTLISNTISNNLYGGISIDRSSATISQNIISHNTTDMNGGGVYLVDSIVSLSGNTISNNALINTGYGGGLCQVSGSIVLTNNVISNNTSPHYGGGLYLDFGSNAALVGNTIISNTAEVGGGVFGRGNITLTNNLIADNTAEAGGGLWLAEDVAATRNTIVGNTAIVGGGVTIGEGAATFNGDIISHNRADIHSGLEIGDGNVTLINSVIADNQSHSSGSGLYAEESQVRLWHTTIVSNSGGSGIYVTKDVYVENSYSSVALTNTILASHTVGISLTQGNTITVNGVLWHNTPLTIAHPLAAAVSVQNEHWGNPAFAADGYHLTPGSAAIDQGVDVGVYADIDGEPRPMDLGFDLGADELRRLSSALYVTKQALPDPVQPGAPLSYTIRVINSGAITLHAAITDTLPTHILPRALPGGSALLPGGIITWTGILLAPGKLWAQTYVITIEAGYQGALTNVVQVTTIEGAAGEYTETSTVTFPHRIYLPLVLRQA